jgi:hypothetical protein
MRVALQCLAPGVENHGHAELGAEMPGISGDDGKCLGRRAEQDRVNGGFVLERDLAERCRQCEDDMKDGTGSSSACQSASHFARANPWHLGQ